MKGIIEIIEKLLQDEFHCSKEHANLVTNKILDEIDEIDSGNEQKGVE